MVNEVLEPVSAQLAWILVQPNKAIYVKRRQNHSRQQYILVFPGNEKVIIHVIKVHISDWLEAIASQKGYVCTSPAKQPSTTSIASTHQPLGDLEPPLVLHRKSLSIFWRSYSVTLYAFWCLHQPHSIVRDPRLTTARVPRRHLLHKTSGNFEIQW